METRKLTAIFAADMVGYSRLMEANEADVLARQKDHKKTLIDPCINANRGRVVKTTGDGILIEFASVQDAVQCAMAIQSDMKDRELDLPEDDRIRYRIGINVGDTIFDEDDIFGDSVNISARLEGLAPPGGICISDAVHQLIPSSVSGQFQSLGTQKVKNITRLIKAWDWSPDRNHSTDELTEKALSQRIEFCIAHDGTQLAYATVGNGQPIFKAPNWLSHLEYEWRNPVWGPMLNQMASQNQLVRFDQRGNGLSDWDVDEISEESMISDMKTVIKAADLDRFPLFAISQGCAFSIRYAIENPGRVQCLILLNGYVRGSLKRKSAEQKSIHEAVTTLVREGWGSPNPAYRAVFTHAMMADATEEQKASFDELQRVATSAENAAQINAMNGEVDVSEYARKIDVPTLVMHCETDQRIPMEEGRRMAALIPGARFVTLPGSNHALIGGTQAFNKFFEEFYGFLEEHI